MTENEQETQTIDMTPKVYGKAYGLASAMVNGADFHDNVNEEDKRHVTTQVVENATDEMVRYVLYRRVLHRMVESEDYELTQEEFDDLMDEIIDEDDDERVRQALQGEEG